MSLLNWGVSVDHPAANVAPEPKKGLAFVNLDKGHYLIDFDGETIGSMQGQRWMGYLSTDRGTKQWDVTWGPYVQDGRGHRSHWRRLHDFKTAKAFVREHIDAIRKGEPIVNIPTSATTDMTPEQYDALVEQAGEALRELATRGTYKASRIYAVELFNRLNETLPREPLKPLE